MGKIYTKKYALILVIVGAINWGAFAFGYNFVELLKDQVDLFFNSNTQIDKVIYILIALAAFKLMNRDTYLPFLGKTVMPTAVIPLKENKNQQDTITIKVQPNSKVIYWAAKKLNNDNHIVWDAYDDYSNSGVVMSDSSGVAKLKLQKGSGYLVPWGNKKIPPHLHYRYELKPGKFSRIETVYF